MKTPCPEDLMDAATILRGEQVDDPTAAGRVAIWLNCVAREQDNRSRQARARKLGVSTGYLRKVEAGLIPG